MDYISSDLHLDDPAVLKYCKRPFLDVSHMQDKIIHEINNLHGKGKLFLLGDSFGKPKKDTIRPILDRINREMVFILGNHDKKVANILADYGEVHDHYETSYHGIKVVMNHFPMYEWNRGQYGSIHFHGHTHGGFQGQGKMLDVGWDAFGRIITLKEAVELADRHPIYQPCHSKNNGKHRDRL